MLVQNVLEAVGRFTELERMSANIARRAGKPHKESAAVVPTDPSGAVDRALAVLCAFSCEHPALGVTEISEQLNLTKSTVHRLLQALLQRGLVAQEPQKRQYTLGYRVLALATAVRGEATLRAICRPHMAWLQSVTGETIALYVVAGDVRMCLDEIESPHMLRMSAGIGRCFPLHRGAASKALLAAGPADSATWQRAVAQLSTDERARLEAELAGLRRRGYAGSAGETVPGAASVAAPIHGPNGEVVAALSVAGPAARFREDAVRRHAARLTEAIGRIERDLQRAQMTGTATPANTMTADGV
jgi:IclR family transcriptional regulator, acetate operon repressor